MTQPPDSEQTFPSTTFAYRKVKIRTPPARQTTVRAKPARFHGLCVWPRTRPLTLTVQHRGGGESWWLIKARGRTAVFPGYLAIEDVMAVVMNESSVWGGGARDR